MKQYKESLWYKLWCKLGLITMILMIVAVIAAMGIIAYGVATDTFFDWDKICGKCNCTVEEEIGEGE